MRPIALVVHHTAGNEQSAAQLRATFKARFGVDYIGYHYAIAPNGDIWKDLRDDQIGIHNNVGQYNNTNSLGISCVGNFSDHLPTDAQLNTLSRLLGELTARYAIPKDRIFGHRDFKATACPGNDLYNWLQEYKQGNHQEDDMTNEEAIDYVYIATQGRKPNESEKAWAVGHVNNEGFESFVRIRLKDDVFGIAWRASEGTAIPNNEKDFWEQYFRDHAEHPVDALGGAWYVDHVEKRLQERDKVIAERDMMIAKLTSERDGLKAEIDSLNKRIDILNAEVAKLQVFLNERTADLKESEEKRTQLQLVLSSTETKLAAVQSQLDQCKLNGVEGMSATDLIVLGLRKFLRIN